jgi:hypothetical protein
MIASHSKQGLAFILVAALGCGVGDERTAGVSTAISSAPDAAPEAGAIVAVPACTPMVPNNCSSGLTFQTCLDIDQATLLPDQRAAGTAEVALIAPARPITEVDLIYWFSGDFTRGGVQKHMLGKDVKLVQPVSGSRSLDFIWKINETSNSVAVAAVAPGWTLVPGTATIAAYVTMTVGMAGGCSTNTVGADICGHTNAPCTVDGDCCYQLRCYQGSKGTFCD